MTATPASEPADAGHLRALVEARKPDVEALADRYGIANIRLFGSVARGEARPDSDVDFLVDLPEDATLFELAGFRRELKRLLRCQGRCGEQPGASPRDRDVLDDAVAL